MDLGLIFQNSIVAAVVAVGVTQMAKKWLPQKIDPKWYQIVFAAIAFAFSAANEFIPAEIQNGFIALSIGTMGYDNIVQLIQKVIGRISDTAGSKSE